MHESEPPTKVDVLVIGSGTAGTNAARQAVKEGAKKVIVVHRSGLTNTCVEAGCMPSKSILAGAHMECDPHTIETTRDAHIARLMDALYDGLTAEAFELIVGDAYIPEARSVRVTHENGTTSHYEPEKIITATGSTPFIPPVSGLETLDKELLLSDDIVAKGHNLKDLPERILVLGGGPIGLELGTFLHEIGKTVVVVEMANILSMFDPEFGAERVRASQDAHSFPIRTQTTLTQVVKENGDIRCTLEHENETAEEIYDAILVATGRKPDTDDLGLENTKITFDERGRIRHDQYLETDHGGIFIAGDATGHHQILHYAAKMGQIAGYNAVHETGQKTVDYDKLMLAVSFDQFPSALIGLTETEAQKQGRAITTATRYFNSIGRGILDRQEYGMWKLIAERETGAIIGSQIVGPQNAGELIQVVTPLIHNKNTYGDILDMTWYHPTYAEIIKSLANDMCETDDTFCPGM